MGDIFKTELDPSCNGFSLSLYGNDQGGINMLIHKYLLKHLLSENECILFYIERDNFKDFLTLFKTLGCLWINGDIIDIETNSCTPHMAVNKDYTIAYVSGPGGCYVWNKEDSKKYLFKQFLNGNIYECIIRKMPKQLYDEMHAERERSEKEKISINRALSLKQVEDEGISI